MWLDLFTSRLDILSHSAKHRLKETMFRFGIYGACENWSRGEQWILFPENLNVSRDEVEGNIEIRGKQTSLLPKGPVIKWFVIWQKTTKANFETCNNIRSPSTERSGHVQQRSTFRQNIVLLHRSFPWHVTFCQPNNASQSATNQLVFF